MTMVNGVWRSTWTKPSLVEAVALIAELEKLDFRTVSDQVFKRLLWKLFNGYVIQPKLDFRDRSLFRAVRCETASDFDNLTQVEYPPASMAKAGLVKLGRCNHEGLATFYAATSLHTALWEAGAAIGDFFRVLECRFSEHRHIGLVGELATAFESDFTSSLHGAAEHVRDSYDFSDEATLTALLIDDYFSECLRTPREKAELLNLFRLTSDICIRLVDDLIEAIMYPSVRRFGGWNVAIPPLVVDRYIRPCNVSVVRITENIGNRFLKWEVERFSSSFASDKAVEWSAGPV